MKMGRGGLYGFWMPFGYVTYVDGGEMTTVGESLPPHKPCSSCFETSFDDLWLGVYASIRNRSPSEVSVFFSIYAFMFGLGRVVEFPFPPDSR